ncbi:MAG: hypothetical protein JJU02_10810 [Cryomorphaceae bacterium]|nr:hypothetical protein [Cryomorphaceae bacterium]
MCFSASASFGAGVVLTVIGVASIKKAESSSQILFASIPLLFAFQQITEGFLWLALSNPVYASFKELTTYVFLFIAQIVWPFWVPFAIIKLVPKEKRRFPEKVLVGIGALVSLYLAFCLAVFPVEAQIIGHHISYLQDYPATISFYCGFLYVAATILPSFLSRIRRMWILGTSILISYIVTTIFYTDYIVSVWCFFASIISVAVLAILYDINYLSNTVSQSTTKKNPKQVFSR